MRDYFHADKVPQEPRPTLSFPCWSCYQSLVLYAQVSAFTGEGGTWYVEDTGIWRRYCWASAPGLKFSEQGSLFSADLLNMAQFDWNRQKIVKSEWLSAKIHPNSGHKKWVLGSFLKTGPWILPPPPPPRVVDYSDSKESEICSQSEHLTFTGAHRRGCGTFCLL